VYVVCMCRVSVCVCYGGRGEEESDKKRESERKRRTEELCGNIRGVGVVREGGTERRWCSCLWII
jgi:hypothetical protein